jgi:hypothetical protein
VRWPDKSWLDRFQPLTLPCVLPKLGRDNRGSIWAPRVRLDLRVQAAKRISDLIARRLPSRLSHFMPFSSSGVAKPAMTG